jgi:RNA polymerase sigma-70 factor, ECF subfamily
MDRMRDTLEMLAPLPDEALLARVVEGDAPAFELLMRRHNQRLYRVARSVLHDALEAEDVVQDAYVRAYANLGAFQGRSSVATWLTRIAFHEALRRRRRGARARAAMSTLSERAHGAEGRESMHGLDEHGPRLDAALDSLPAGVRTVVVLRLVQGLSTRETAECTRLSEANVKVMLHRGKHLLAERLGDAAGDLRERYAFGAERCDRVVEAVFRRLSGAAFYNER